MNDRIRLCIGYNFNIRNYRIYIYCFSPFPLFFLFFFFFFFLILSNENRARSISRWKDVYELKISEQMCEKGIFIAIIYCHRHFVFMFLVTFKKRRISFLPSDFCAMTGAILTDESTFYDSHFLLSVIFAKSRKLRPWRTSWYAASLWITSERVLRDTRGIFHRSDTINKTSALLFASMVTGETRERREIGFADAVSTEQRRAKCREINNEQRKQADRKKKKGRKWAKEKSLTRVCGIFFSDRNRRCLAESKSAD